MGFYGGLKDKQFDILVSRIEYETDLLGLVGKTRTFLLDYTLTEKQYNKLMEISGKVLERLDKEGKV